MRVWPVWLQPHVLERTTRGSRQVFCTWSFHVQTKFDTTENSGSSAIRTDRPEYPRSEGPAESVWVDGRSAGPGHRFGHRLDSVESFGDGEGGARRGESGGTGSDTLAGRNPFLSTGPGRKTLEGNWVLIISQPDDVSVVSTRSVRVCSSSLPAGATSTICPFGCRFEPRSFRKPRCRRRDRRRSHPGQDRLRRWDPPGRLRRHPRRGRDCLRQCGQGRRLPGGSLDAH
ncbi:MAG: hypothetical protein CM1200mP2_12900 [Planctomycetaceae bacterium]|nr:MAG: hypothetical protein CM1200mP2_12900 [Planctomycetaceae bacterium]